MQGYINLKGYGEFQADVTRLEHFSDHFLGNALVLRGVKQLGH
jgi:hypothetical protein